MEHQEEWLLEKATAEKYEELFVPALFSAWAIKMLDAVQATEGNNILDVACGTGIVARTIKDHLKNKITVTGVDLNPAMLRVAQQIRSDIKWVKGNAEKLPFKNEIYDIVLCQAALMFFPDKVRALEEMKRVLKKEGKLAVQVWGKSEAYDIFIDILEEISGPEAAMIMKAPYVLQDTNLLCEVFDMAGIPVTDLRTDQTVLKAPSLDKWLQVELESWALSGKVDPEVILHVARERLQKFCAPNSTIEIPMEGHIAIAIKQ